MVFWFRDSVEGNDRRIYRCVGVINNVESDWDYARGWRATEAQVCGIVGGRCRSLRCRQAGRVIQVCMAFPETIAVFCRSGTAFPTGRYHRRAVPRLVAFSCRPLLLLPRCE